MNNYRNAFNFFGLNNTGNTMNRKLFTYVLCTSVSIGAFASNQSSVNENSSNAAQENQNFLDLPNEFKERQASKFVPSPHSPDLLGENYDLTSGRVTFERVDANIPGNSQLEVAYRTKYDVDRPEFTGWVEQVPHIYIDFDSDYAPDAWKGISPSYCSGSQDLPRLNFRYHDYLEDIEKNARVSADFYTSGLQLVIPGKTSSKVLSNNGSVVNQTNFKYVTKDNWAIKCVTTDAGVDAFKVYSPNGTTYLMDVYEQDSLRDNKIKIGVSSFSKSRHKLLVSRIEDKFGNYVTYNFSQLGKLESIVANDGRKLEVTYENGDKKVTAHGKTWTYSTNTTTDEFTVTEPGDRVWKYNLFHYETRNNPEYEACDTDLLDNWDMTVQHPDGITGTFTFDFKEQTRVNVDKYFVVHPTRSDLTTAVSKCAMNLSLVTKTLSGAGLSDLQWHYWYSENNGRFTNETLSTSGEEFTKLSKMLETDFSYVDLPNHIVDKNSKATIISEPNGGKNVYFINRDASSFKENSIEAISKYNKSDQLVESTNMYHQAGKEIGRAIAKNRSNRDLDTIKPVLNKREVTLSTSTYTTEYSDFNDYNKYRKSYEHNSFDNTKIRYTKYGFVHDSQNWALNLPSSIAVSSDDVTYTTTSSTSYKDLSFVTSDSTTNVVKVPDILSSFGLWHSQITEYHQEEGTSFELGLVKKKIYNQATEFENQTGYRYVQYESHMRGQAGKITVPNRIDMSKTDIINLAMDNFGLIESIEDRRGFTTNYKYDDAGRLLSVKYPRQEGEPAWLGKLVTWTKDGGTDTNQPKMTITSCLLNETNDACQADTTRFEEITTFDALLRPTLKESKEVDENKSVYQNFSYTQLNEQTFESFPHTTKNYSEGITKSFDVLNRLVSKSSMAGGSISYTYQAGNKIKTTDAGKNSSNLKHDTTTTYLAYGAPAFEQATFIDSPDDIVDTNIVYNIYGQITSVTQSGLRGEAEISSTESHVYNDYQQLCKVVREDVGTTIYSRNNLGRVEWHAAGTTLNETDNCNVVDVAGTEKVSYKYDNLGQVYSITYGDSTATLTYSRDKNGNLTGVSSTDYTHSYQYNSQDQLKNESISIDNKTLALTYTRDNLGNIASVLYPNTEQPIQYAPNGFGQATQAIRTFNDNSVDEFVKGGDNKAQYYANGALDTFVYGNNIVHKTNVNARYLPTNISDKLLDKVAVDLGYTYDNSSNVLTITNNREQGYNITDINYDALNRLHTVTGEGNIGSSTVTYDSLGNILTYAKSTGWNTHDYAYEYNTHHQLEKVNENNSAVYDFTNGYDKRGNVKNNGKMTFDYNLAQHMVSAGSIEYTYDGHNRRVKIKKPNENTEYSLYSLAGKLMYRENQHGEGTNYIYFSDKLVAKEGAAVKLPQPNSSQTSIAHYKPFGENLEEDNDGIGYTGHKFDADTGLVYMQARYYDPVIGRFYSNDPVGFTNVHTFNRYAYANNNPYKYIDPDGRSAKAFKMAYNVVRKASRNGWDFKKAGADEIASFVDNAATLADGRFTSDDVFAAIDIVTGFGKEAKNFLGKQTRNQRLRDLVDDPKVSSADRGWIKQEMNEVAQGKKGHLRNPPGKDLAHQRGRENAKGYGYEHADLQNRKDHKTQHKLDDWGRKNKERGF